MENLIHMKNVDIEKFLDLVQKNGHKLIHFNPNAVIIPAEANHKYMSVFDYSIKYGGTYDSSKYYNNNVVDVTQNKIKEILYYEN